MPEMNLDTLIKRVEEIPTLPVVARKIMSLLDEEEVDYRKITELIEKDPALAVKILKVANSSFYGTISKVGTIEHALAILGIDEIRAILMAFSIYNFFRDQDANVFDRNRFWQHAIVCSQISKYLAANFSLRDDSIFLSGLIHDIGKIVFDSYFHDEFMQILVHVAEHNMSFSLAEKNVLGVTHYQVAAKLLQQWNLPVKVVRHVFYHHAPWHDREYTSGSIVVYLANNLAKIAGYSSLLEEQPTDPLSLSTPKLIQFFALNGFDLDEKAISVMIANIRQFIAQESDNVLRLFDE